MTIFTIGFTQKTARRFFELIKSNNIQLVLDIRLNNASQLAGFTKGPDLEYFLSAICRCGYVYCGCYAPTKELREGAKQGKLSRPEYEDRYTRLIEQRGASKLFAEYAGGYENICLLCSEPEADNCHRRLLAEILAGEYPDITVKHI